jgi:hypothetical protein
VRPDKCMNTYEARGCGVDLLLLSLVSDVAIK